METWKFRVLISALSLIFGSCCASPKAGNRSIVAGSRIFMGVANRAGDMSFIGGLATTISSPAEIEDMFCTAFLIAQQWVLTAAHCYQSGITNFLLRAPPEKRGILVIPVEKWNIHPDYNYASRQPKHADIALVYLGNVLEGVMPVKIADPKLDEISVFQTWPFRGMMLTVAGYGLIDKKATRPKSLPKTYVYLLNSCNYRGVDYARAFCHATGPIGEGPCPGDSGAPVMLETANRKLALGIHSSGDSGCRSMARPWGNQGLNVRISWYFDWIKKTMCAHDGSTLPYTNYVCNEQYEITKN